MSKPEELPGYLSEHRFPFVSEGARASELGQLSETNLRYNELDFRKIATSMDGKYGEFSFRALEPGFIEIDKHLKQLMASDLTVFPPAIIERLKDAIKSMIAWHEMITKTPHENNPTAHIQNTVPIIAREMNTLAVNLMPVISYLRTTDVSVLPIEHARREVVKILKDARDIFKEGSEDHRLFKEESSRLLDKCTERLQQSIVSRQADQFTNLAKQYKSEAHKWLWAMVICAALIIAVALLFFWLAADMSHIDLGVSIQFVASKLVMISVLTFILVALTRNYRAYCHNQILAEHRATTLNTFETFLEAAHSNETRDKLLTLVAETTFNPKQTGYDHADREGGHPMQQILDLHGTMSKSNSP